jgi:hypothetical protein
METKAMEQRPMERRVMRMREYAEGAGHYGAWGGGVLLNEAADTIERLVAALLDCARQADALKRPCGDNPESEQAQRNGQYASISATAHIALGTVRGPQPYNARNQADRPA